MRQLAETISKNLALSEKELREKFCTQALFLRRKTVFLPQRETMLVTADYRQLLPENLEGEVERLKLVFTKDLVELLQNGEKSNMGKSIGIGAATGAGVGGLVTAITAAVESSNINCRVGDGLAQVGLNKSHSIDSLRDIYVKWNLNLPETAAPADRQWPGSRASTAAPGHTAG